MCDLPTESKHGNVQRNVNISSPFRKKCHTHMQTLEHTALALSSIIRLMMDCHNTANNNIDYFNDDYLNNSEIITMN
jgi:hypothetical protein